MASELLSERDLSNRWGLSARTLQRWRWRRQGPPYVKLGRRVAYRANDIDEWEERNRYVHEPNSDRRLKSRKRSKVS